MYLFSKNFLFLLLFCHGLLFCSQSNGFAQDKKILIINSYHRGFDWSDIVINGIESVFYKTPNITINTLYMDSKRIHSKEYYAKLRELYRLQLNNRKYDLIIAVDTFAYDFVLTYYNEFFTNEPVLFSGLESYDVQRVAKLGLEDRIYGIIEKRPIRENFELIVTIMPYLKKLTIINDGSENGDDTHPFLQKQIEKYKKNFHISYIRKSTLQDIQTLFSKQKKSEAIFFIRFYNDKKGNLYKNSQIASMIDKLKVPVFVTDKLFFGHGAYGGKLVNIDNLGVETGKMAIEILKKNTSFLHVKEFNDYMYGFDYKKIHEFKIYPTSITTPFSIINKPLSFFQKYRTLIDDAFLITPFLILLIIGLVYNMYKRVQSEKELQIIQEQKNKHQQFVIQQSKLAEIGEIFSSIAHQWKNPLVEISAIVQEHLYFNKIPVDNSYVDDIMVQVKYMDDTINNFQKFIIPSKEKSIFSIDETVNTILRILDHTMRYNYIDIKINKQKAQNFMVRGYKNEFMQTILNILNNAKDQIKYAREQKKIKRGKISIKLYTKNKNIIIDICDNGGGIKQNNLKKIFEPYFTTKTKGHGIGLYMTKLIIEDKMQGSIDVKNMDEGACFSICLENVDENIIT